MTDQDRLLDDPSNADWNALARFIAGECTPQEGREVERALEAAPDRGALVQALSAAVRAPDPAPPSAVEIEAALANVRNRAVEGRSGPPTRRADVISLADYRSRWRNSRFAAAAAVLVVAGAGLVWRAASTPSAVRSPVSAQARFATATGAMDSVRLPDGSHVLLGPGSELALAPGFAAGTRELTLKGEARFDVVHDASHPFIVHAGSASFRDVGTVFAVHSDQADGARVVVTEGAVAVVDRSGSTAVTLLAGDRAVVAAGGGVRVERGSATSEDLAWTSGRLVFRDAPVAQVAADLRRWFGIDLRVDSAFATRHLSTPFERGMAASDVGKIVALALGGALHEEGGALHIVPLGSGRLPK